jgi:hypothetical protein
MKFILVPILMMLVLTQTFSKWLVVFEYKLNKDYIAQKLCVNKAKPKLHCNGKCQMMKRLAEEGKQSSTNTTNNTSKIKMPELIYSNEVNQFLLPLSDISVVSYNEEPSTFIHRVPAFPIFHPPALS